MSDVVANRTTTGKPVGLTHLAFSVGSKESVDNLTNDLRMGGFPVIGKARTTGDGYYESIIADPDGNLIEITYLLKK